MAERTWTRGVHHVGLTVPDAEQTKGFFVDTLGFEVVGGRPDYPALFVSDGTVMITLWQAVDPPRARAFDRKNQVGLHHVALRVESHAALAAVHALLAATEGVEIEFGPEPLGGSGAHHLMCSIPGGVRLELVAAPEA